MNGIAIRRAQAEDVSAISGLARRCFAGPLAEYLITSQPGYGESVAEMLRAGDRQVFIASAGTRLVAFAEVAPTVDSGRRLHLSRIAVSPTMQGQSVGTRLLTEIGSRYFEGHDWSLDVFESNVRAVGWYRKLGFTVTGMQYWLGREIPFAEPVAQFGIREPERRRWETRGFGPLQLGQGEELALVGRSVRCKTLDQFESDSLLASVRQALPSVERAFAVVEHDEAVGVTRRQGVRVLGTALKMGGKLAG